MTDLCALVTGKRRAAALMAVAVLALIIAYLAGRQAGTPPAASVAAGEPAAAAGARLYACPMNDVPPLPAPGTCPVCGMELVALPLDEDGNAKLPRLVLSPGQARKAEVVLGVAERRPVAADIRLFGQIEYDPKHFYQINAVTGGVIEKLTMVQPGDILRGGQSLFEFSSPEILDNEIELRNISRRIPNYVRLQLGEANFLSRNDGGGPQNRPHTQAEGGRGQAGPRLAGANEDQRKLNVHIDDIKPEEAETLQRRFAALHYRLRDFGFFDRDVAQIVRQAAVRLGVISVRVPGVGGVLIENTAALGRYVNAGTPIMTIANPSYVWASLRAFEADYPWLRVGQDVELTVAALPGEVFRGSITQVDPTFDPKTRTFGVNVAYTDKNFRLRPNMLAKAVVKATLDESGHPVEPTDQAVRAPLLIPETAPLVTGRRAVVFVASLEDENSFEAREVTLGPRTAGGYVVRAGLREGERIVVNGAFKLDSELQIRGKPSMMNPVGLARLAPAGPESQTGMDPAGPGGHTRPQPDAAGMPASPSRQFPGRPAPQAAQMRPAPGPGAGEPLSALVPLPPPLPSGEPNGAGDAPDPVSPAL